uniref:IST1-like protein n=1 Tax=Fagus sylvatica TaxID=28930 RepID=A0A2N9GPR1_FAGSY
MGKKLDAFLGKTFKKSKFINLVNLAVSRIAELEKQHSVRCGQAHSDVIQLLNLGHQERALLRVEVVIREQNMLDAYVMIENYCHLLVERVVLIQNNKECPNELNEAVSSLLFAASRCGEMPELQKIRRMFTSRFGKEFATRAVELCTNCGVNPKEEKLDVNQKQMQPEPNKSANLNNPQLQAIIDDLPAELRQDENFIKSMEERKKYRDWGSAAAAEAAFIFATRAAAAARAAVELSQPQDKAPDEGSSKSEPQSYWNATLEGKKHVNNGLTYDKIHNIDNLSSKVLPASSLSPYGHNLSGRKKASHSRNEILGKESGFVRFSDKNIEDLDTQYSKHHGFDSDRKSNELKFPADQKASTLVGESSLESTNQRRFCKAI